MTLPLTVVRPVVLAALVGALLAALLGADLSRSGGTDSLVGARGEQQTSGASPAPADRVAESYGKLPLSFEPNRGQTDRRVKFIARGSGYGVFLTATEAVLALGKPVADGEANPGSLLAELGRREAVLRMRLLGANPKAVAGRKPLTGRVNYLSGSDPRRWRTGIPTFAEVSYSGVYPGVDLVYYGNQRRLEYDFVVAPGADPRVIQLRFGGADALSTSRRADLLLQTAAGELRQPRPVAYQKIGGERRAVSARYVLEGGQRVGFELGAYDRSRPLVIDPVLDYSTYLGGSATDQGLDVAVDPRGNAYLTGGTFSPNFPTKNPFQPVNAGAQDAFVTKLDRSGSALDYSTYLGGNLDDAGLEIAVDSPGHAYVVGQTYSSNFPTKDAFQPANAGSPDAFVAKLNQSGSALDYSTYLGGSAFDVGWGIAVEPRGNAGHAYVVGQTLSPDFPTKDAFQPVNRGGFDAFVTKLDDSGSALVYSTYLGGSNNDGLVGFLDVAVEPSGPNAGYAYVTGDTESADFPTKNAFQPANAGLSDAFVAKLHRSGSALIYSTYLGGSGFDYGLGVTVDPPGEAHLTGATSSPNFPTQNAFQPANAGGFDAFVTKLHRSGSALIYSTYLGGSLEDFGFAVDLDPPGHGYVTGRTHSPDFPTKDAFQPANAGTIDAFVSKLHRDGSALVYSSYLGGVLDDEGYGIAVHPPGEAYLTGWTRSPNFPTKDAFQPANAGDLDAYATKVRR